MRGVEPPGRGWRYHEAETSGAVLFDIVFPSATPDLDRRLRAWVQSIRKKAWPRLAKEAELYVRKEHSTYDWVMEGLLWQAGFRVLQKLTDAGFQATYVCTRM